MQNTYLLYLRNIYKAFIDNKFLPKEEEDLSMRKFTAAYNVTDAQAKILAYLLQRVPELTDEESRRLAEMFGLSGGQISNVVAKRNLAELYYEGDRGFDYIMNLCKEEAEEPIMGTARKVGF